MSPSSYNLVWQADLRLWIKKKEKPKNVSGFRLACESPWAESKNLTRENKTRLQSLCGWQDVSVSQKCQLWAPQAIEVEHDSASQRDADRPALETEQVSSPGEFPGAQLLLVGSPLISTFTCGKGGLSCSPEPAKAARRAASGWMTASVQGRMRGSAEQMFQKASRRS